MNKTLKRRLVALGLSFSMASGAISGNILPAAAIVSAKSFHAYKVNSYGVLTKYSGSSDVHIRANVSALTTTVFDNMKVTSFSVNSNNKYFKAVDGVLYTKDGKKLVRYPSGRKGAFVVPSTVTSIAQDAFRGCSVTSIQIPDSVSAIGNSAFYNCKKLETINIPSKVTALRKNMFYHCSSLKNITLPPKLEVLGNSAFKGCRSLESISLPSSLNKMGNYIFNDCKSLTEISIPKKLTTIPYSAFKNCSSLTQIQFGSNIEDINMLSFQNCTSLKSITIPGTVDTIGAAAFENCENLQKVNLKNGISTIETGAFKNCTNLESIKLPNSVDAVYYRAFENCSNLKKAILSDQINILSSSIFKNCSKLKTVHLPKSLTVIENAAFSDCTSLTTIKIPKNVVSINNSSFINTGTAFVVDTDNSDFSSEDGVLYNKNKSTLLKFPSYKSGNYKTPGSVKKISSAAFRSCYKIKNVTIGEGITKLTKICFTDSSVEELTLPSTLKVLNQVKYSIDAPNLKSVTVSDKNKHFASEHGMLYTKDKTILCIYPAGKTGTVTFPGETSDLNNIETQNKASKFAVASGSAVYAADDGMLTNLEKSKIYAVPAAKTSYNMGRKMRNVDALINAKYATKNLKEFTVNKKNSKFSSKDGVLLNKYKTKIVFYPNAKAGEYTTPSSVSLIKETAFSYASKLTDLTLGKNIAKCSLSFTDCSSLKNLLVKESSLRNFSISTSGTTQIQKVTLPTSLISANIYCSKAAAENLTIVGWTNTSADKLARKINAKFVSVGLIPKQLKNVKVKAYVNLKVVKISWKKDPQVSGYEIYSENRKLKTIKDNNVTEASIYVGDNYYSTLYIRSYKIQKGKKIYGKAKKVKYYPYS